MGTRMSSRVRAPVPTALVLALLLAMGSSWSHIANGVRTTPLDSGVLGGATAALPVEGEEDGEGRDPVVAEREELWATGSRLPDCAHACGPCSPCRRVMVSFMCAQASESCPVAYRCMCRGRFFRVPSL